MTHYASSEWIWGIGIIVVAIAIAYAAIRTSRRSRAEKRLTNEATKQVYREENRSE